MWDTPHFHRGSINHGNFRAAACAPSQPLALSKPASVHIWSNWYGESAKMSAYWTGDTNIIQTWPYLGKPLAIRGPPLENNWSQALASFTDRHEAKFRIYVQEAKDRLWTKGLKPSHSKARREWSHILWHLRLHTSKIGNCGDLSFWCLSSANQVCNQEECLTRPKSRETKLPSLAQ